MATRLIWPTSPAHQDGAVISGVQRTRFDIESLECRKLLSSVGNIFVANSASHGVSETSTTGKLLNPALVAGVGEAGIAVSGSDLFIVNKAAGTVGEYTTSGETVNAKLVTGLIAPDFILIDGADLFVVDDSDSRIGKYTLSGTPVSVGLIEGVYNIDGIAGNSSDLYIMSGLPNSLHCFIAEYTTDGVVVNPALITSIETEGGLNLLGSELLVTDSLAAFIREYNTAGALVNPTLIKFEGGVIGLPGTNPVTVAGSDLFVITYDNYIAEFTTTGQTINTKLISNTLDPVQLATDGSNLYVLNGSDYGGLELTSVSKYTLAGATESTDLIPAHNNGIAVWGSDLFLTNSDAGTIAEYTTDGALVNPALIIGLNSPGALTVFGDRLFVADAAGVGEYTTTGQTIDATLITQPDVSSIHTFGSDLLVASGETIGEFSMTGATLNLALVAGINTLPSSIVDFTVSGNDLFVATYGYYIVHPSGPRPGIIAEFTTSGVLVNPSLVTAPDDYFGGIAAFGSNLYVSDSSAGTVSQYSLAGVLQGTVNYVGTTGYYSTENLLCIEPASVGPATQLVPLQSPAFVPVGSAVPIVIAVEDADGNVVTDESGAIALATANGASIGGTLSQPVAGGVAIFSDITFPHAAKYTLTASDGALAPATFSLTANGVLTPAVTVSNVPSSAIGGVALHARVTVWLNNDSPTRITGLDYIRIYATTDGAIDTIATLITTQRRRLAIKPSGRVAAQIPIASFPADLTAGKYTLLVQTTNPAGLITTSTSGPTVNVAAPFIALQETIKASSVPPTVLANKRSRAVIQVTITNSGNIVYSGPTYIEMDLSADGSIDDKSAPLVRLTAFLRIPPGKTFLAKIPVHKIPSLPAGAYSLVVEVIDPTHQGSTAVYSPVMVQG